MSGTPQAHLLEVKGVFLVWDILFRLSDHPMGGNLFSNLSFFILGAEEISIHFEEWEDSLFLHKYSLSDTVKESSDSICNENIYNFNCKNKSL